LPIYRKQPPLSRFSCSRVSCVRDDCTMGFLQLIHGEDGGDSGGKFAGSSLTFEVSLV